MLHNPDSNQPARNAAEPSLGTASISLVDRVSALIGQAESARASKQYNVAAQKAREVLKQTNFPPPDELLTLDLPTLPGRFDSQLHPSLALALTIVARYIWADLPRTAPADLARNQSLIKRSFQAACALEPDNMAHREGMHGFMSNLRKDRTRDRNLIAQEVDSLREELIQVLGQRFQFDPLSHNWIRSDYSPQQRKDLIWGLVESGFLACSRAHTLLSDDRQTAKGMYKEALHFATCSLVVMGLPTNPGSFDQIRFEGITAAGRKELTRIVHTLERAYSVLGPENCYRDANRFAEELDRRMASTSRESTGDSLPGVRSVPVDPAASLVLPPRSSVSAAAKPAPAPAPEPSVTKNAWLSPCRLAVRNDPFTIPENVLKSCHGPFDRIRKELKFPRADLVKAVEEFAIEIDLLARTQNDSAALYLQHYNAFFKDYSQDPIILIRIQTGVGYLLQTDWLADELKQPARVLAAQTNETLQRMELRQDLATVQQVFKPITDAAKFKRLRPA